MEIKRVKACFTITFTHEQFIHSKSFVDDMRKHPKRVFWYGKQEKTDDQLVIEQIAHRILSGFYKDDSYSAGKQILKMDSTVNVG